MTSWCSFVIGFGVVGKFALAPAIGTSLFICSLISGAWVNAYKGISTYKQSYFRLSADHRRASWKGSNGGIWILRSPRTWFYAFNGYGIEAPVVPTNTLGVKTFEAVLYTWPWLRTLRFSSGWMHGVNLPYSSLQADLIIVELADLNLLPLLKDRMFVYLMSLPQCLVSKEARRKPCKVYQLEFVMSDNSSSP